MRSRLGFLCLFFGLFSENDKVSRLAKKNCISTGCLKRFWMEILSHLINDFLRFIFDWKLDNEMQMQIEIDSINYQYHK